MPDAASEAARMTRVLFVDDEPVLLEGLRDLLRPRRRQWKMEFATSGEAALARLAEHQYDVVVSDMRMPGMDGATLLTHVQRLQPDAVRIVLSGFAEISAIARAAPVAHRFIGKPCGAAELASVIERSCALSALTKAEGLRRAAARTIKLPRVPETHRRLAALLQDGGGSLGDAAALVEQDIAISARVLQMANSAFFGSQRAISGLHEAVAYVGLRTLAALTVAAGAVGAFEPCRPIPHFSVDRVQSHGANVARIARGLLTDPGMKDDAVAAAMLHDIGLLVLAVEEPDYLAEVLTAAHDEGRPLAEVEYERRGISHAEVGAHLLALWGLPHQLVEAVAFHHRPSAAPAPALDAVAAVHIADALVSELESGDGGVESSYLALLDAEDRLPEWRAFAARELGVVEHR
jgi:HD-like signal output (HDOD) protein